MYNKSINLFEYTPKSELVVEKHNITSPRFPIIDTHSHFGLPFLGDDYENKYETAEIVEKLKKYGVRNIVNVDGMCGNELDRMLMKIHPFEDFILTYGNVDILRLDEKNFESYVYKTLAESKNKGIKGLKFWKDISLVLKDSGGRYIPIDDIRLKVIWETAAQLDLPVLIHIADPTAFFRPIDTNNERYEELVNHPDWSFYGEGIFKFEELMEMQENLLANNPKTTFIIAHGGSYSENLGFVSRCLDSYPNMYIDIADRISEFGRQPYTSRKFFNRYKDRIVFGSDGLPLSPNYYNYFRFMETWDEYFEYSAYSIPPQGRWNIYGIGLEDEALENIYYKNAEKILKLKK